MLSFLQKFVSGKIDRTQLFNMVSPDYQTIPTFNFMVDLMENASVSPEAVAKVLEFIE